MSWRQVKRVVEIRDKKRKRRKNLGLKYRQKEWKSKVWFVTMAGGDEGEDESGCLAADENTLAAGRLRFVLLVVFVLG